MIGIEIFFFYRIEFLIGIRNSHKREFFPKVGIACPSNRSASVKKSRIAVDAADRKYLSMMMYIFKNIAKQASRTPVSEKTGR